MQPHRDPRRRAEVHQRPATAVVQSPTGQSFARPITQTEVVVRILQVFAFCFAALSIAVPVRADDKKKPEKESDYASLIVGKWQGTGKFANVTLEYTKEGKHTTTAVVNPGAKPNVVPGTWKIKGDKLTQTLNTTTVTLTITKLTEKEFFFKNNVGAEATYERVVEKKSRN
jgi:uncharacterized protein (TIGR03066 family)